MLFMRRLIARERPVRLAGALRSKGFLRFHYVRIYGSHRSLLLWAMAPASMIVSWGRTRSPGHREEE